MYLCICVFDLPASVEIAEMTCRAVSRAVYLYLCNCVIVYLCNCVFELPASVEIAEMTCLAVSSAMQPFGINVVHTDAIVCKTLHQIFCLTI